MVEYLIIGTGLFGAVCVWELTGRGRSVMILDKRSHFGGNAFTEATEGIYVHRYGAHNADSYEEMRQKIAESSSVLAQFK